MPQRVASFDLLLKPIRSDRRWSLEALDPALSSCIVRGSMFRPLNTISRVVVLTLAASAFTAGPVISTAYAECCRRAEASKKISKSSPEGNRSSSKSRPSDESDRTPTSNGIQLVAPSASAKSTQLTPSTVGVSFGFDGLVGFNRHAFVGRTWDSSLPVTSAAPIRAYDATAPPRN